MARDALKGLRPGDPRDIGVASFEIEHEQTFHLKELYKYLHEYILNEEGFESYWGDDKHETLYWERQNAAGLREHHIWWRFYKYPNKNQYYRYFLKIDFQTLAMGTKEVIQNGQKFKLDSGDVIIRVQAYLQLDYKDEWPKNRILKNFDSWFRNRLYKSQLDMIQMDLYKSTYRIQNNIKQFLKLATPSDMIPAYQPQKGMR